MKLTVNGKILEVKVLQTYPRGVSFEVAGKTYLVERDLSGSTHLGEGSKQESIKKNNLRKTDSHILTAPISGLITSLAVKVGDQVSVGSELVTLEAMKMQNKIFSSRDGIVDEILVRVGSEVSEEDAILRFK